MHIIRLCRLLPAAIIIGCLAGPIASSQAQEASLVEPELAAQGVWDASTTYAKDDVVTARGSAWISLKPNNVGKLPGQTHPSNVKWWRVFARGFNPTGAWSNATTYQPDDLVTFGGQTYRAKLTSLNKATTKASYWELLAAKGAPGPNTGIAAGSSSVPAISFNGDTDTGIYSPAAGKIAMVENGALFLHNLGTNNAAFGLSALAANTVGTDNTAVGSSALSSSTNSVGNTAVGSFALAATASGGFNTAVGSGALKNNSASNNTALGSSALFLNNTGSENTAVGEEALAFNTTGLSNTAVGMQALMKNTTGTYNTAVGVTALTSNTTGIFNVAIGYNALAANTTADSNIAVGPNTLAQNTTGFYNTAIGLGALGANITGDSNSALGRGALASNTIGASNTAVGLEALNSNVDGNFNTAVGKGALAANTEGLNNTAVGTAALSSNTLGGSNVAAGYSALLANTIGINNVAVGETALNINTEGSNNIAIGFQAGTTAPNDANSNIFIGNPGSAGDTSPTTRIGNTQTRAFIAGISGVTVANSSAVLINTATGQLGTVSSSRRYKQDIATMGDMSAMLAKLRPVTFHYKKSYIEGDKPLEYGLIAEEVADVFPDLAVFKDGAPETVKYHLLPSFLLVGYQTQQKTIAAQSEKIEALEERLRRLEALLPQTKAASLR